jgi:hypothetical protein
MTYYPVDPPPRFVRGPTGAVFDLYAHREAQALAPARRNADDQARWRARDAAGLAQAPSADLVTLIKLKLAEANEQCSSP